MSAFHAFNVEAVCRVGTMQSPSAVQCRQVKGQRAEYPADGLGFEQRGCEKKTHHAGQLEARWLGPIKHSFNNPHALL